MARHTIGISELGIDQSGIPSDLTQKCDLRFGPQDRPMTQEELCDFVAGLDGLLFTSRDRFDSSVLEHAASLKVAIKSGAKPTNIDYAYAAQRGIAVGWTPGANSRSVAEYTVTVTLVSLRKILAACASVRDGEWRSPAHIGDELFGKVVGVLGFGSVGAEVARLFSALGATVVAFDPYPADADFVAAGVERVTLEELMRRSDVLTLHSTLTDETRTIVNRNTLALMKRSAIIVNTARGELISDEALLDALESKSIAGAALDVFSEEPLPIEHPFRNFDNVLLSPHVAARTIDSLTRERVWALTDIVNYLEGNRLSRASIE